MDKCKLLLIMLMTISLSLTGLLSFCITRLHNTEIQRPYSAKYEYSNGIKVIEYNGEIGYLIPVNKLHEYLSYPQITNALYIRI